MLRRSSLQPIEEQVLTVPGEYPKGWAHTLEIMVGLETDTSEILNEMIESVKSFGRVGITGVYVG